MTGTHDRLTPPGVSEFFEVIVQIETMVLNACPALMRPTPLRSPAVLKLAEALAGAVRAATRGQSCECGPNTICADHLCPCGCGDPPLTRGAQESLDAYRERVVEHDRAYIRRKIGEST